MDEGLFIDHVDTEWCLRAKSQGFRLFGVPSAAMEHRIGGEVRSVRLGGRVRHVSLHSPLRLYCNQRNSLLLHRRGYPSLRWRLADLSRMVMRFVYYGILAEGRSENLRWLLRGIWDGIRGLEGPPPGLEGAA
jgi:rhamnosyltransferase